MTSGYRPEIIQSAFVDFIGSHLHPFWSLTAPKLRLMARYALSDDLIALQFEVNRAFKQSVFNISPFKSPNGWQGGQHLYLKVWLDGIYHQRSYSLVGMPYQPLWWDNTNNNDKKSPRHTLTIAVKPQGVVSHYLTKLAPIGTVFDSSLPTGDFTLKKQANRVSDVQSLLFIASGSGITPMLSLITQALKQGHQVTLLHYNRTPLLVNYWQSLAVDYPAFTYHLINTQDPTTYLADTRHLTAQSLLALNLPLAETQIFACGSAALLASLYDAASAITLPNDFSLHDNIVIESFGTALPALAVHDNKDDETDLTSGIASATKAHTVYLRARQRQFDSSNTLLIDAEQAGMRMPYGCRQGICQLCRCNKVSGVVKNIQTGKVSADGLESIQTCINRAMTDVILDI